MFCCLPHVMKLPVRQQLLPWIILPVGLLGLYLWWGSCHMDYMRVGDVAPLAHRNTPATLLATRITEHSAYQALVPRTVPTDEGVVERIRQIRQRRGEKLSPAERELAMEFLAGKVIVDGVSGSAFHWLADEVLTSLRLQEPPQSGLAKNLTAIASDPATDPVIRDYISQHLGHLWEQRGFDQDVADGLWATLDSSDETTPGSALIALSGGYTRDGNVEQLARVRAKAFELASNPATPLSARVTAFGIAGEGASEETRGLATRLLVKEDTPLILKRIAEAILQKGKS